MQAELPPGEELEQLIEGAGATRQRDHPVGQLGHQRLALVHRLDDVQLGQAGVGDLELDKPCGDDADHRPARPEHAVGERSHQTHARATVDELELALGQQPAQLLGSGHVLGPSTRARATEDKDAFHRHERSSLAS